MLSLFERFGTVCVDKQVYPIEVVPALSKLWRAMAADRTDAMLFEPTH